MRKFILYIASFILIWWYRIRNSLCRRYSVAQLNNDATLITVDYTFHDTNYKIYLPYQRNKILSMRNNRYFLVDGDKREEIIGLAPGVINRFTAHDLGGKSIIVYNDGEEKKLDDKEFPF